MYVKNQQHSVGQLTRCAQEIVLSLPSTGEAMW